MRGKQIANRLAPKNLKGETNTKKATTPISQMTATMAMRPLPQLPVIHRVTAGETADTGGVNDRDTSTATKPTPKPTTKPASIRSSIPDVPEVPDTPDRVVGVVEHEKPSLTLFNNQPPAGNEQQELLADMREIWDHHRLSGWNTKPADIERAVTLSDQYGKRTFLLAFDSWCSNDASDQIETKNYETLKFPLPKFFGQVEYYKNRSMDSYEVKRRTKSDSCPTVREPVLAGSAIQ